MPALGSALDFAKYEARNLRAHQLGVAPSSPVTGQLYFNTGDNTLYWYDGSQWVPAKATASVGDATTTSKGIVQLAGDLTGTAASPQIAAGVITDGDVNAANKDGAAGTPSLRTLGSGAQQALAGTTRLDQIAAPTAAVALNGQRATGLADPTAAQDAATKGYVDATTQGLDPKLSVKAASTANLTLSGTQTIDGVALVAGDRVLVKNQSTASANGIYVVAAGAWSRASDMDAWSEVPAAFCFVEQGTTQADTGWVCTSDQGGTIGSTAIAFAQFSGAGEYVAGNGLTLTGNTFDVNADNATVEINADIVRVKDGGITDAKLASGISASKLSGTVSVANGGTGQSTAKAGRETGLGAAGYYTTATHGAGTTISVPAATHGLRASQGLLVQVQDAATGAVEIPDIAVSSTGDVTVTYGVSVTANSKRVTVVG